MKSESRCASASHVWRSDERTGPETSDTVRVIFGNSLVRVDAEAEQLSSPSRCLGEPTKVPRKHPRARGCSFE